MARQRSCFRQKRRGVGRAVVYTSRHLGVCPFFTYEMLSKECFLRMIEMSGGCSVGWWFSFVSLLFLFYDSWAFPCLQDLLRCIMVFVMISLWPRMSMITIMSFLSYRDAIQLHDSHFKRSRFSMAMLGRLLATAGFNAAMSVTFFMHWPSCACSCRPCLDVRNPIGPLSL
jgi:hypothetical protein